MLLVWVPLVVPYGAAGRPGVPLFHLAAGICRVCVPGACARGGRRDALAHASRQLGRRSAAAGVRSRGADQSGAGHARHGGRVHPGERARRVAQLLLRVCASAWLRRIWQSAELYEFLADASAGSKNPAAGRSAQPSLSFRHVGRGRQRHGRGTGRGTGRTADGGRELLGQPEDGRSPSRRAGFWTRGTNGRAVFIKDYEPAGSPTALGAYGVPIPSKVGPRGMLIAVLPKGALFIADDIALLRICCREAAVQLDNAALADQTAGADRRAGTADRPAGRGQQGARGVFLFGVARPARAAPAHQRLHRPAGKIRGTGDRRRRAGDTSG